MATTANRGAELLCVNIVFGVMAGIVVCLRCYTRVALVKGFGLDDWAMILATVFFLICCILSNLGVRSGTGQHLEDLEPENIALSLKYWWLCYLFCSLAMITCKLSFAWFLLRITTQRRHAWIIYGASLCTVLGGFPFFFVSLFQCNPVSFYWNKNQPGTCMEMNIIMALGYVYSVFSVITDFTFAILPAFVIWNLQLQKKAKIAAVILITMGCLASTAVVVRCVYLPKFKNPDFLWATTDIAIWSTIEMGLAIITASLATLRPLFKAMCWKLGLTTQGTRVTTSLSQKRTQPIGCSKQAFSTNNTSEDRIYASSDIILADGYSNWNNSQLQSTAPHSPVDPQSIPLA